MNKTVELVTLWGKYEEDHPNASIEDFCRHLLTSERESANTPDMVADNLGPIPVDGLLLRTISKISRLNMMYVNLAFEGTGLNQIEEFGMLLTIKRQGNPRKSEVIYDNMLELSSGTDMVNRLVKRGFITEHSDKEDKRAKRLRLTASGEKVFLKSFGKIAKSSKMLLQDMTVEDKKLCIQLLKEVERKFFKRWTQDRTKEFEEIYKDVVSAKGGKEVGE